MQIDHIFVRARPGAPEAEMLREFGLSEGSGNRHPGQGTANRRFFFQNGFLELLWIDNEEECLSEQARPTMLHERLSGQHAGAAPFGVCFRPSGQPAAAPFPAWSYAPGYLPAGLKVDIAADTPLSEPMWFYLSFAAPPKPEQQPLVHAAGLREISGLTVAMPNAPQLSPAAQIASAQCGIRFIHSHEHLLTISFDKEVRGRTRDFRPGLPLVFKY